MDHWHDDTTREAFVAEAEGEANFVQTAVLYRKRPGRKLAQIAQASAFDRAV